MAIVSSPLFDFGDQFQGHIERARAALLFEGQVPAGLGATRPFEGREAAFEEGASWAMWRRAASRAWVCRLGTIALGFMVAWCRRWAGGN